MSRAPLGKHTVPGGLLEKLADPLPRDQVQPGNLPDKPLSSVYRTCQLCLSSLVSRSATVASSTGATWERMRKARPQSQPH